MTNRLSVSLPALNRTVPLNAYVAAVKLAKANPETEFKTGLDTWWPTTGAEIRRQYRRAVHDRINRAIPLAVYCGGRGANIMQGVIADMMKDTKANEAVYREAARLARAQAEGETTTC